ncbi:amino acid adenylation domain-containing protein [Aquimarina sp. MMG015]|uniref:non-ribosomal peptide synthetase n=1 Tax=Aquimarina sp. MMG015 TaxID=2822689 RepID=UPI001B3A572C|nr:non-ribosomal peptide synthetase [Aquimarina sp. MMG015]MBQ4803344.1 amino acid adenylation domain-containing protein [Aquimarina sp. MMG015]
MNKKVVHTVFETVVEKFQDKIAIQSDSQNITYSKLNTFANNIASVLINNDINKGDKVATLFSDEILNIISLIGIFKSNSIYIPIDRNFKENHWKEIYTVIKPKILLLDKKGVEEIEKYNSQFEYTIPHIIVLSFDNNDLGISGLGENDTKELIGVTSSDMNPNLEISGEDSSYIFFTSGSSGAPKMVLGQHKSLSHYIHWEVNEFNISQDVRLGFLGSMSFDASLRDVFVPLISGGTICIPPQNVKNNFVLLSDWIRNEKISLIHTVPTIFRTLLIEDTNSDPFKDLELLFLAGEKLFYKDIINWRERYGNNTLMVNLYGATESTLVKTFYKIEDNINSPSSDVVSIGKAISNSGILILNEENEVCEINEVGRIFIKTPFLSKGYYKDEKLTAKKFIQNPLNLEKDIIYDSGDYGKYDAQRNVTIIGREDGIVKINGVRVDTNYVEQVIIASDKVRMTKCLLLEGIEKEYNLYCFYQSSDDGIENDIKKYSLSKLSTYEVPSFFIPLKQIPFNVNKKIDVKALKTIAKEYLNSKKEPEVYNETEGKLKLIWKELLGVEAISLEDNFLFLGGNSIKLIRLNSRISNTFNVALNITELFSNLTIKSQSKLIRSKEQKVVEYIEKTDEKENHIVTPSQYRLWVMSKIPKNSVAFNMPRQVKLDGNIEINLLQKAILSVIKRHEMLRTVFVSPNDEEVFQKVLGIDDISFRVNFKDFEDKTSEFEDYISKDANEPFDLEKGPLFRCCLIKINGEYIFYTNMHHIISDGWSEEVLIKEVNLFYDAYLKDEKPVLPELKIQYKDYSAWLSTRFDSNTIEGQKDYWANKLEGELPRIDFITNKNRPSIKTFNGRKLSTSINKDVIKELNSFCNENEGSIFIGILSAIKILLSKYTHNNDIIIGAPIAGRDALELENLIGYFGNILVLRNQIDQKKSFLEIFNSIKNNTLEAYANQQYPFNDIVNDLGIKTDLSRNPIFDISVTFHNISKKDILTEDNFEEGLIIDSGACFSKNDIEFHFGETRDSLVMTLKFNEDVYGKDFIENLIKHFKSILSNLLKESKKSISGINYISSQELKMLVEDNNSTRVNYSPTNLVSGFKAITDTNPDTLAMFFEGTELSYKELDEISNQFANCLRNDYGIKPGDRVGVHLLRSEKVIVSILGILKAGAVYVPIDPDLPEYRKSHILEDSSVSLLITETMFMFDLEYYSGDLLAVDVEFDGSNYASDSLDIVIEDSMLAYIIYTSGSTGLPKGVMISHGSIINTILSQISIFNLSDCTRSLQFASYSFDASISEIFITLLSGSSLYIVGDRERNDPEALTDYLTTNKIEIATLPPAYLRLMDIKSLSSLKYLVTAGESPDYDVVKAFLNYGTYFNAYGPTETSICGTILRIDQGTELFSGPISIGSPIWNTEVYILDTYNNVQPEGISGEICIGGQGLAEGYLNQEELTQTRFISHPFKSGEKLYKTGDLGRWLPDGTIEYLGRQDDQVKVNGHRIELGEIEFQLRSKPSIKEVAVFVQEDKGQKSLVSYLVSDQEETSDSLRTFLRSRLPEYMVPNTYIQLDHIPITSNGKVDKKLLSKEEFTEISTGIEYEAPVTEEQKALVLVCQDVLNREQISMRDNFYNLGGDSIKSIQVVSRLKQHGYQLKVEDILRYPILIELSSHITGEIRDIDQATVEGTLALTPIQEFFFKDLATENPHYYNQSLVLRSSEDIDQDLLEKSIAALCSHHDALRMIYNRSETSWTQTNKGSSGTHYEISYYDLRGETNAKDKLYELGSALQSSINIESGPLFKIGHFRLDDGDRIALILHHLVVDGVSWRILLEDLTALYEGYRSNTAVSLPLKTDSFKYWSDALQEYSKSEALEVEQEYWQSLLKDQSLKALPTDKNPIGVTTINSRESFALSPEVTNLLQTKVHGVYNTEVNDVLLTGLGLALKEVFGLEKNLIKLEGHGREQIKEELDISRTVGWFTTTYPLVIDISKDSLSSALINVKESIRKVPNKGIGYGILKYLTQSIKEDIEPRILFNYLGDFGNTAGVKKGGVFEYSGDNIGASIDKRNGEDTVLDISGIMAGEELNISIRYSDEVYNSETIERLSESYHKHLKGLIEELSANEFSKITPSDLTFEELTVEELDVINSNNDIEDVYKLSPLQLGIYYHWLSSSSSFMYLEQISYRILSNNVQVDVLKEAYDKLVHRHAALRTSFTNAYAGTPLQVVHKSVPSNFSYEKVPDGLGKQEKETFTKSRKVQDREEGFDLESGSQMRLKVIEIDSGEYEFIWSYHHIIMDGWCMSILINDFYQLINSIELPKPSKYSEYIKWIDKINEKDSLGYWKSYLKGYDTAVKIPFSISTENRSYVENKEEFIIKPDVYDQISKLCNQEGVTVNTFIQGVWGYLLSRYNDKEDVVFGTIVSGRPGNLKGVETMIGMFSNTIPVRITSKDETPISLLQKIHKRGIEGNSHHYLGLGSIQSESELGMNLINHIMIFENYPVQEVIEEDFNSGNSIQNSRIESVDFFDQSNYDFNIVIIPNPDSLRVKIRYNTLKYSEEGIRTIVEHMQVMIEEFLYNSDQELTTLNYLPEKEINSLVSEKNATEVTYSVSDLVSGFESIVNSHSDSLALYFNDTRLTYSELDELSNQLSHCLRDNYSIKPGDRVGVHLTRSDRVIVSILGILKLGAVYVPIDPDLPEYRKSHILEDSSVNLLITETMFMFDLEYYSGDLLAIDVEFDGSDYDSDSLGVVIESSMLAYIIYTSGSTGLPKGVMVSHGSIINTIMSQISIFCMLDCRHSLQFASYSFDASISEIFITLLSGCGLFIASDNERTDPKLLEDFIKLHQIDIATLPPAYLRLMDVESLRDMRYLITAGESPDYESVKSYLSYGTYFNAYGPTETSICGTILRIDQGTELSPGPISIGSPIWNTEVYILDSYNNMLPEGVIGELCIGGKGLAEGYVNQEGLTALRFITHPFKEDVKLYKTGDLARWLPDGTIEYLGRRDDQVKINGHRIELGEVEFQLRSKNSIQEVAVLVDSSGLSKELVAYLVSEEEETSDNLRSYLKKLLPDYMIPTSYVQLDEIPINNNGKVDKKALSKEVFTKLDTGIVYEAPVTDEQHALVSVCQDVLNRNQIGLQDNFYNLGGDSIKSIQVVSRLKQQGYQLRVEDILRTPVLGELSAYITGDIRDIDQGLVEGDIILTPIQEFFFQNLGKANPHHYNQSVVLRSSAAIDRDCLERSIAKLCEHHDALRMVYKNSSDDWVQANGDVSKNNYEIIYYDLQGDINATARIQEIGSSIQSSINLETGPLFKIGHFRLDDGDRLALIIHHLVIDGVSWRILLEDLSSLYNGYALETSVSLPLKTDSFQYWSNLLQDYAKSESLERELEYWKSLVEEGSFGRLPVDKEVSGPLKINTNQSFVISEEVTNLLQTKVHSVYNTEINDVLLTGLGLAIKDIFDLDKSLIKMEGHGREQITEDIDVSRTVGWFTSVYPFLLRANDLLSEEALVQVKEDLRRIPNKGIGYGVLKYLTDQLPGDIHPEILFNYLGDFGDKIGGNKDGFFEYSNENIGASVAKENSQDTLLDISGIMIGGRLNISIRYCDKVYESDTIKRLSESYNKHLESLILQLSDKEASCITPSDLTFKGLTIQELAEINKDQAIEDIYKLSPLQLGIYYHWLTSSSTLLYFEQTTYRINSLDLNTNDLKEAYDQLVSRYAVLRTSFTNAYAGTPLQIVHKTVPSNFFYEKVSDSLDKSEQEKYVEAAKEQDREEGFELEAPSQMRLKIFELKNGEFEFIWSHHHVILDGWCTSILINDFYQILDSIQQKKELKLSKPADYVSYIKWLERRNKKDSLDFWKTYLLDFNQVSEIPFKNIEYDNIAYKESKERLSIEGELFDKINELCQANGVTLNSLMQSVWGYLLSRYNDVNDVVFGTVVSGRPGDLKGIEEMIGLFSNMIPVRLSYERDATSVDLIYQMKENSINCASHHYLNLAEVQSQSAIKKDLINSIIVFENFPIQERLNQSDSVDINVESVGGTDQSNYDFNLTILPTVSSIKINFRYNETKYDSNGIKLLVSHFYRLLERFSSAPEEPLGSFNYISDKEVNQITNTFNVSEIKPSSKTILDDFSEQVKRKPNEIAVRDINGELTYEEINKLSDQLAYELKNIHGISERDLVGIQIEPSNWILVAVLGILKSGAAFVPIDQKLPKIRKEFIVNDANIKLLITDSNSMFDLDYYEEKVLAIDIELDISKEIDPLGYNLSNDLPAYIIYTSGSTGNPKGVIIEHKSLYNYISWGKSYYLENDLINTNFGLFTSLSFDLTISSLFLPLVSGGAVQVFAVSDNLTNVLSTYLGSNISCIKLTPAHVSLLDGLDLKSETIELAIIGGDTLNKQHIRILRDINPSIKIFNEYGPTECTVGCITEEINKHQDLISIGYPIDNTKIYILDQNNNIQPKGVIGEICVAGVGLANGYLNRSDLTKEKFIQNPFNISEKLYKTGDLGRWLEDGKIEFLGRKDNQVKIRGYRIELNEIVSCMQTLEQIRDCVAIARPNSLGGNELVAYYVSEQEIKLEFIQNYLLERLPEYMVPDHIIRIDEIPLTINGKIDKDQLPKVNKSISSKNYVAPRNEIEERLIQLIADLLNREKNEIGINDNFFDLGMNSLEMMKMENLIRREFEVEIRLALLFKYPNVNELTNLFLHDNNDKVEKEEEKDYAPEIDEILDIISE